VTNSFVVCLVHLVSLVYPVSLVQPHKRDKPNTPEQPAGSHASLVSRAPLKYLQLLVTEGAGGSYFGGKTAEPSISSSEATGSNKSMTMPALESTVLTPSPDPRIQC
jgi:hypothetical protein